MKEDTVVALRQPETFSDDPLTDVLRAGARRLLAQAIEAEVEARMAIFEFIEGWYNPGRRHSALGYRSPVNFERSVHQRLETANP